MHSFAPFSLLKSLKFCQFFAKILLNYYIYQNFAKVRLHIREFTCNTSMKSESTCIVRTKLRAEGPEDARRDGHVEKAVRVAHVRGEDVCHPRTAAPPVDLG